MNKLYVIEKIKEELGNGVVVEYVDVAKDNGTQNGIKITKEGSNISPVIYYSSNESDSTIISRVIKVYNDSANPGIDTDELSKNMLDWNWVKDRIYPRLYNNAKSTYEDLYSVDFVGDVSIMFYIQLITSVGKGMIKITNQMVNAWDVPKGEIMWHAKDNLNKVLLVDDMINIMIQMMFGGNDNDERYIKTGDIMTIMSTISKSHGAAAMLLVEDLINNGELVCQDYYFLPSSVHEVIMLKEYDECFKEMVGQVNATEVAPADVLSDSVFKYNHITRKFEVV